MWSHGQISHGQIFISWSNFWGQIRMNMIQTPIFTVYNKFWNIKIWFQTESNENEWKAVLSLLRSILHRICNELWMKLLSLTQNPVCVSNITQENEASVNKNTCLSFLFQLHASACGAAAMYFRQAKPPCHRPPHHCCCYCSVLFCKIGQTVVLRVFESCFIFH